MSIDRVRLPAFRIGAAAGLVAMLCCVGPTVLAVIGVLTGAAAFDLATDLYGDYAWYFRGAGLVAAALFVYWSLRRQNACSLGGVKAAARSLGLIVVVGVATYALLYAVTTWLGTLA